MIDSAIIDGIKRKFQRMKAELDERGRRFWAANEAIELGYGGINAVAQSTGLGRSTIHRGCKDIRQDNTVIDYGKRRVRQPGGAASAENLGNGAIAKWRFLVRDSRSACVFTERKRSENAGFTKRRQVIA